RRRSPAPGCSSSCCRTGTGRRTSCPRCMATGPWRTFLPHTDSSYSNPRTWTRRCSVCATPTPRKHRCTGAREPRTCHSSSITSTRSRRHCLSCGDARIGARSPSSVNSPKYPKSLALPRPSRSRRGCSSSWPSCRKSSRPCLTTPVITRPRRSTTHSRSGQSTRLDRSTSCTVSASWRTWRARCWTRRIPARPSTSPGSPWTAPRRTTHRRRCKRCCATREGWSYAGMGRTTAYTRSVAQAEDLLEEGHGEELPSWARNFDHTELSGVVGARYRDLALGQDDKSAQLKYAQTSADYITQALRLRAPGKKRNRVFDLVGLGRTYLMLEEPEEAARV